MAGILPRVLVEMESIVEQYAAPDFHDGNVPILVAPPLGAMLVPGHGGGTNYHNTCGLLHVVQRLACPGPLFPQIMAVPVGAYVANVMYTYARANIVSIDVFRT